MIQTPTITQTSVHPDNGQPNYRANSDEPFTNERFWGGDSRPATLLGLRIGNNTGTALWALIFDAEYAATNDPPLMGIRIPADDTGEFSGRLPLEDGLVVAASTMLETLQPPSGDPPLMAVATLKTR